MKKTTKIVIALAASAALGLGAWLFIRSSTPMGASSTEAANAGEIASDPSKWTIPQGEDATRRHIRDGLKAGAIDPVTGQRILNYHDPMVPGKNFDSPAKSPFMDMMLVPRYAGSQSGDNSNITVSPRIQQNLGVRTVAAAMGTLSAEIQAVGSVAWNERDQVLVQSRAMGFVEKVYVRATLDRVGAGQTVVELHIPEWVAAQEDYLALNRMVGTERDSLRSAALERMRRLGMNEAQIQDLVNQGRANTRIQIKSPIGGVVTELMVREGMTVMPGMTLLRIQGTSSVWAEGEVPESLAGSLVPGSRVFATTPAAPNARLEGRVQTLLPQVDLTTRTIKARLELPNPSGRLVPGMQILMRFYQAAQKPVLLVPSDAVIQTGRRSVVMLAGEKGQFQPVEVTTGREVNGQIEIVSGLQAGQKVVLSGQFLIDSEASLRGLEARLNQAAPATEPTHATDATIKALSKDTVTLDHPPIASLKWPQMVMDFKLPARDKQPRDLANGEQVRVEFRMQEGDVPQIISIQRVAPGAAK